jgi:gliding motility-associated-like protein
MRSIVILTALLLTHLASTAQALKWAQRLGNNKGDKITCVKTDGLGYIYIAGYYSVGITLGTNALALPSTQSVNSKEAFIAKLDSTGFCYWAKYGSAYFDDRILGLSVDSAGYAVVTGTYWEGSGINFPPLNISGAGVGSGDQAFVVKFDPNGNALWGKYICGNSYGDDQGLDVVQDKAGNIYTVGFMTNTTLMLQGSAVTATNPNTVGTYKHCYWLTKMNSNGVFQWAKTFGNLPWDPSHFKYVERDIAVARDEADGIYITGGFDGANRQFGTSTFTSAGGYDIFVMKYDTSGNFKWATQGGSDKDDWSSGICSDNNGHVYITGEHRDSLIMDTVLVKNYDARDVFVFKIDAQTGKPYWGKRAGSDEGGERGNDVWADDQCNVYVCGDINEGAKFGDNIFTPVNGQGVQTFIARMTPEGKWTWVVTGGGSGDDDRGAALAKGKANQVYLAGYFKTPATFGSAALTSSGGSDGFLLRLHDSMLNRGTPFIFTTPVKTVLCFGDTAHLSIPKHAFFQITPTTGVQFNNDTSKLVFAPSVTTTYTMTGFTAGVCGEYDTATFTITVGQEPVFTLNTPADTTICKGEMINLALMQHSHFEIAPITGTGLNAAQTILSFSPPVTTTYTLSGYISGTCPSYDTVKVTIVVNPSPDAEFTVTPDVTYLENPNFTLLNTSTGADSYEWYNGANQLFSTSYSPSVTESAVGTYCYKLIASTSAGCVDSAKDCGDIIRNEIVYFPTAFSPNGDQRNDEFRPVLMNVDFRLVKDFSLVIVNRFGEVMYKSVQASSAWDGTWHGVKCELGTYYYSCTFTTPQGKAYNVKGDVSLIY